MENCTVSDLKDMGFDKSTKPLKFVDGTSEILVTNWTELSSEFVNWLIQKGHLIQEKLPVPNHANRGKYFIHSEPHHKYSDSGGWHHIGGFYFDTKYNAQDHVKNIISTVSFLSVHNPSFKITFRKH